MTHGMIHELLEEAYHDQKLCKRLFVKTRKITTVKKAWISGLISIGFNDVILLRLLLSFCFVGEDVSKLESAFHRLSNQVEFRSK